MGISFIPPIYRRLSAAVERVAQNREEQKKILSVCMYVTSAAVLYTIVYTAL